MTRNNNTPHLQSHHHTPPPQPHQIIAQITSTLLIATSAFSALLFHLPSSPAAPLPLGCACSPASAPVPVALGPLLIVTTVPFPFPLAVATLDDPAVTLTLFGISVAVFVMITMLAEPVILAPDDKGDVLFVFAAPHSASNPAIPPSWSRKKHLPAPRASLSRVWHWGSV